MLKYPWHSAGVHNISNGAHRIDALHLLYLHILPHRYTRGNRSGIFLCLTVTAAQCAYLTTWIKLRVLISLLFFNGVDLSWYNCEGKQLQIGCFKINHWFQKSGSKLLYEHMASAADIFAGNEKKVLDKLWKQEYHMCVVSEG